MGYPAARGERFPSVFGVLIIFIIMESFLVFLTSTNNLLKSSDTGYLAMEVRVQLGWVFFYVPPALLHPAGGGTDINWGQGHVSPFSYALPRNFFSLSFLKTNHLFYLFILHFQIKTLT